MGPWHPWGHPPRPWGRGHPLRGTCLPQSPGGAVCATDARSCPCTPPPSQLPPSPADPPRATPRFPGGCSRGRSRRRWRRGQGICSGRTSSAAAAVSGWWRGARAPTAPAHTGCQCCQPSALLHPAAPHCTPLHRGSTPATAAGRTRLGQMQCLQPSHTHALVTHVRVAVFLPRVPMRCPACHACCHYGVALRVPPHLPGLTWAKKGDCTPR